eukprot:scaffold234800_cov39-Prasinocladus_malaysianus.AAC.1
MPDEMHANLVFSLYIDFGLMDANRWKVQVIAVYLYENGVTEAQLPSREISVMMTIQRPYY